MAYDAAREVVVLVGELAAERAREKEAPDDWCYVNNFEAPDKPIALKLPRGMACRLRSDMQHAVEELLAQQASADQPALVLRNAERRGFVASANPRNTAASSHHLFCPPCQKRHQAKPVAK